MEQVFTQVITFMRETPINFSMFGQDWSFTFMDITVGIMIIEVGIYIVERILNHD